MNRDYAPIDRHESIFSALDETGQDLGYGLGIGQDHRGAPEIHDGRRRSGNTPLISPGHQALSPEPYEQFRTHRGASVTVTAPAEELPDPDRSTSQNSQRASVKRKPVHSSYSLQNLRNIYSPDFHKHAQDKKRPYAKIYDFRRTRDKLLRTSLLQWVVTIFIVAAIVAVLIGYQQNKAIDKAQKHVFNAIITGLAIALGINLASSLRSYADLMRWRLLACSWLSLQEFDLILSCSSQRKIFELMLTTPRRRKFPFLSWIQFVCVLWIAVNVAAQVLVAMLGLVYSLDNASQNIISIGPTSIVDLSTIRDIDGAPSDDTSGQQFSAHSYGVQGQDFPVLISNDPMEASEDHTETVFTSPAYSSFFYRFTDYAPDDPTTYHVSKRTVNVTSVCNAFAVTGSAVPYFDGHLLPGALFYYSDNNNVNMSLYVREFAYGCTTYMSDNDLSCGERCARVLVYQAAQEQTSQNQQLAISQNMIFDCNNTIGEITSATKDGEKFTLPSKDPARAIAGAIGWTGFLDNLGNGSFDNLEYQLFSNDSYWSPPVQLTAMGRFSASRFISQYSIAALAAMDRNGPKVIIADGDQPQQALIVTVEWGNAAALLAVIVGLQLIFLLVVVFWANKAVIKDDSFLAIAKLLAPTVMTLGEHGSVLRGDEIAHAVDYQKGGNYRIFYGWKEVREDEDGGSGSSHVGHRSSLGAGSIRSTLYGADAALQAGIIERGMGIYPDFQKPFVDGKYD